MPDQPDNAADQPASQSGNPRKLKVMGLGLVGLGLLLQLFYFLLFSRDPCVPSSPSNSLFPLVLVVGVGLAVIGLASYARAKGRHVAIGLLAFLPVLGPILAIVAIALSDLSLPWIIRRLIIALILVGSLAALTIPNFLRYGMKARQAEVRMNLGGIYAAEMSFYDARKRFGNFEEIGFTLPGTTNRYTYRIDGSGARGTVIPNGTGQATGDNTVVPAGISPGGQGFTATATANLDADATIDQWHVNDRKDCLLRPDTDDVPN